MKLIVSNEEPERPRLKFSLLTAAVSCIYLAWLGFLIWLIRGWL